ncbi:hypothetical protein FACS1894180_6850 [Bacteroidia bacterium]|nr:hypothetical protein FACS1894180_6850 [Bacteroidia bacterium]
MHVEILGDVKYNMKSGSINPSQFWGFFILCVILGVITAFYWIGNVQTAVNKDGIFVKYFPFMWKYKFFEWSEIAEWEVKKYNPLLETGGWGYKIRFNVFFNKGLTNAYNVSGNKGLFLRLHSGRKILVGTQKAEELQELLQEFGKNG